MTAPDTPPATDPAATAQRHLLAVVAAFTLSALIATPAVVYVRLLFTDPHGPRDALTLLVGALVLAVVCWRFQVWHDQADLIERQARNHDRSRA